MLAIFGLGLQEIIVLGVLAAIGLGTVLLILFLVKGAGRSADSALAQENQRLRDELDRAREKS